MIGILCDKDFYEALGFPADEKQLTQGFDIMQLSERVHPDDRSKFVNDTRFVLSHRDANQTTQCRIDFGERLSVVGIPERRDLPQQRQEELYDRWPMPEHTVV